MARPIQCVTILFSVRFCEVGYLWKAALDVLLRDEGTSEGGRERTFGTLVIVQENS